MLVLLGMRPRRAALVLTAAALVLSGCGGQGAAEEARVPSGHGRPAAASSPEPTVVAPRTPMSPGAAEQQPSLPPGDPGLEAPSVPDPGLGETEAHGHEASRRAVPLSAMLTADSVRMVAGAGWQRRAGGGDECVGPEGALAVRSMSYGGTDAGIVVETVATYRDAGAADRAVAALAKDAAGCGWEAGPDPRLGSASATATDGRRSIAAVSSEGVAVLLVGSGAIATDQVRWGSLVDLALGTSCAAAPDGCH